MKYKWKTNNHKGKKKSDVKWNVKCNVICNVKYNIKCNVKCNVKCDVKCNVECNVLDVICLFIYFWSLVQVLFLHLVNKSNLMNQKMKSPINCLFALLLNYQKISKQTFFRIKVGMYKGLAKQLLWGLGAESCTPPRTAKISGIKS